MNDTKEWRNGYKNGEEAVFEFLKEMEKIDNVDDLEKEYRQWENADVVILPNGNKLDKSTGELTEAKCKDCGQKLDFYERDCDYCLPCFDTNHKDDIVSTEGEQNE